MGYSYFDPGMHITSQIHAVIIVACAFYLLFDKELNKDTVHGYSDIGTAMYEYYSFNSRYTIACGYFLWDVIMSIYDYKSGFAFVFHGISCFLVFMCSYKPVFNYFGCRLLMYEISTIFLNIHWYFLDYKGTIIRLL